MHLSEESSNEDVTLNMMKMKRAKTKGLERCQKHVRRICTYNL